MKKKLSILLLSFLLILLLLFFIDFIRNEDEVSLDGVGNLPVHEGDEPFAKETDTESPIDLKDRVSLNQEKVLFGTVYDGIKDEQHLLEGVDYYALSNTTEILFHGTNNADGTFEVRRKSFTDISKVYFHKKGYMPQCVTDFTGGVLPLSVVLAKCGYLAIHLDSTDSAYDGGLEIDITNVETDLTIDESSLKPAREFCNVDDDYQVSPVQVISMEEGYDEYAYPIPVGLWRIRITLEKGFSIQSKKTYVDHAETAHLDMVLHDPGVISGKFVDEDGKGIADIEVFFSPAEYVSQHGSGYNVFDEYRCSRGNQEIIAKKYMTKTNTRGEFKADRLVKGVKYMVDYWDFWEYECEFDHELIEADYEGLIIRCVKRPVLTLYIKEPSGSLLDVRTGIVMISVFSDNGMMSYDLTITENPCRIPMCKRDDEDNSSEQVVIRTLVNDKYIGKVELEKNPYQHSMKKEIIVDPIDPDNLYRIEDIPFNAQHISVIEDHEGSYEDSDWSIDDRLSWDRFSDDLVLINDLKEDGSVTVYSPNKVVMVYLWSEDGDDCAYIDYSANKKLIHCNTRRVNLFRKEDDADLRDLGINVFVCCPKYNRSIRQFRSPIGNDPEKLIRNWPVGLKYIFRFYYLGQDDRSFERTFYLKEGEGEYYVVR